MNHSIKEEAPKPEIELTDEEFEAVLAALQKGSPLRHACVSNGVHWKNFSNEIFSGLDQLEFGIKDSQSSKRAQALYKMERHVMQSCLEQIRYNENGHKGAQFYLERLYWRDFSGDARVLQMADELEELKIMMLNQGRSRRCIK